MYIFAVLSCTQCEKRGLEGPGSGCIYHTLGWISLTVFFCFLVNFAMHKEDIPHPSKMSVVPPPTSCRGEGSGQIQLYKVQGWMLAAVKVPPFMT